MTAPTTRETADHAELAGVIKYLRREAASNKAKRSGQAHGAHFVTRARKLNQAASSLETLLSEIAALRGGMENLETAAFAYQDRATQAERQRDEAVGLLKQFHTRIMMERRCNSLGVNVAEPIMEKTRAFLANQGADQCRE